MKAWLPYPIAFLCSYFPSPQAGLQAQCLTTISDFPYTESFEAAPQWLAGGTNSDWAWGTPAHPTISSAAGGTKAWCVGGLMGSFYSNGQQSWLETPCVDLSTLANPWVRFSIWWETEPAYDGVGFQYSPNGGTTWLNVGEVDEPEDCHTANWFNSANITALNLASPRRGWSGTSVSGGCASGNGSGAFVVAAHCLVDLPTTQPVKFRFIFGAGTICNTFDGVAIDEFQIGEAPPLDPSFSYTCNGNTITFTGGGLAGCIDDGAWSFGDPASGTFNTAVGVNATHTYPGPGAYVVNFTATSSCSAPATVERTIEIPDISFTITDVECLPNTGAVTATVTGSTGPFTYDWEPGGAGSATIGGLAPGDYTVLVQAPNMCPVQGIATVGADANSLTALASAVNVSCTGADDGSATVAVSGGSGPYTYAWSPISGSGDTVTDLGPGEYGCSITDDAGCSTEVTVAIAEPALLVATAGDAGPVCEGDALTLSAAAVGGTGTVSFVWSPAGPVVEPATTATYTVVATDANGCTSPPDQVTVAVNAAVEPVLAWDVNEGCAPLCVTFVDVTPIAGVRNWSFSDGGTAGDLPEVIHCFNGAGPSGATLTVTPPDGCAGTVALPDIITVLERPLASFATMPAVALIGDPRFQFINNSVGGVSWGWSFGDPAASVSEEEGPVFSYPAVGCYTAVLVVTNDVGCMDTARSVVCVEDEFAVYAPNCFTPNDDGINDVFDMVLSVGDARDLNLSIFDRWGGLVHTSNDPMEGWDGSGLPVGVYTWTLRVRDRVGDVQERQGRVTLLR